MHSYVIVFLFLHTSLSSLRIYVFLGVVIILFSLALVTRSSREKKENLIFLMKKTYVDNKVQYWHSDCHETKQGVFDHQIVLFCNRLYPLCIRSTQLMHENCLRMFNKRFYDTNLKLKKTKTFRTCYLLTTS
jgi:hypothetical protein